MSSCKTEVSKSNLILTSNVSLLDSKTWVVLCYQILRNCSSEVSRERSVAETQMAWAKLLIQLTPFTGKARQRMKY